MLFLILSFDSAPVHNGGSHHVIPHLSNLSLHIPYTESDDIIIGDGSLTHTDSTSLKTTIIFENVFCVPSMYKNDFNFSILYLQ